MSADLTGPNWLQAWEQTVAEATAIRREHYGTRYARTLSTDQLKALWDRYDGSDDTIGDDRISGEAIHCVLNERGEGAYCAV